MSMVHIANNKNGHPLLKTAWKHFATECRTQGRPVPRIMQAYGHAAASADTHGDGLAVDWDSTDEWYAILWRKMFGAPAWPRLWAGNYHTHALLSESRSAAYQVRAYKIRRDGLGWKGLKGRDTLPFYPVKSTMVAIAAWTGRGKIPVDGKLGPVTVKALQRFLNGRRGKNVPIAVDGIWGVQTTGALAFYLANYTTSGLSPTVTGGLEVVRAFQRWQKVSPVTGRVDKNTTRKIQTWLNAGK